MRPSIFDEHHFIQRRRSPGLSPVEATAMLERLLFIASESGDFQARARRNLDQPAPIPLETSRVRSALLLLYEPTCWEEADEARLQSIRDELRSFDRTRAEEIVRARLSVEVTSEGGFLERYLETRERGGEAD